MVLTSLILFGRLFQSLIDEGKKECRWLFVLDLGSSNECAARLVLFFFSFKSSVGIFTKSSSALFISVNLLLALLSSNGTQSNFCRMLLLGV